MLQKRPLLSLLLKPEHSRAHGDKRLDVRTAQHAFDLKEQCLCICFLWRDCLDASAWSRANAICLVFPSLSCKDFFRSFLKASA